VHLCEVLIPLHGVLPTVYKIKKLKKLPGPKQGLWSHNNNNNNNNNNSFHLFFLYWVSVDVAKAPVTETLCQS
jgi:hypothetical protein